MSKASSDGKTSPAKESGGSSFLSDLRGSASGAEASATPGKSGRRFSSSYIMAAGMVAISAAALYGMRTYGRKAGLHSQAVTVDYKPSGNEAVTAAKTQRILAELEAHGAPVQIPAEVIKRNPFLLANAAPPAPVDTSNPADSKAAERARLEAIKRQKELERQISEKAGNLEVTGVMMGARPVVRVSGKLYRVGDLINKQFLVVEITERGVRLKYQSNPPGDTGDGTEFERLMRQALNPDGSRPDEPDPR